MAAKKIKYPLGNDNRLHSKLVSFLESKIDAPCNVLAREILMLVDDHRRLKIVEGVPVQTPNNARDAICPCFDTWTVIDHNGVIMYKIPACINQGKHAPVA